MRRRYSVEGSTVAEIARELSSTPTTVSAAIARHGLPAPPPRPLAAPGGITEVWLHHQFVGLRRSVKVIAAEAGVWPNMVRGAIKDYELQRPSTPTLPGPLNAAWLKRRYVRRPSMSPPSPPRPT